MLSVNGKSVEWKADITLKEIYRQIGYTISNPRVIVRINGETVARADRNNCRIPDSAEIEIINTLCGG